MRILLVVLFGFALVPLMAQQNLRMTAGAISSATFGAEKHYYADPGEPPRAIEFREKTVAASLFINNIHQHLGIPAEFTFAEIESNSDQLGMRHRRLQQYYKGIPVEGMVYRIHERNGFLTSANGRAVRTMRPDINVVLSESHALQLAAKHLQTTDTTVRKGTKLIVSKGFTFTPESFVVAYQFDIDVSFIERWRISIDARNGDVINKVSLVNSCSGHEELPPPSGTGTGISSYYGTRTIRVENAGGESSRMAGETENGGVIGTYDFHHASVIALIWGLDVPVYSFYSQDNTFNDPYHRTAVSVHWAAEQVYEYYFRKHNRNSYNNNGAQIISYVHVDQNFDNALWTGRVMAFGDGSRNNPLVELDVVSHELTHGVIQHEANLNYSYEPGALNESFADIFGKAVEFDTFGDTATWQLAKHFRAGGLRDFSNPNLQGQPDTYQGHLWYTGYDDAGGVHYNSGVQNFWFYLLSEGGTGVNDHQFSYSVNPIGIEPAANIAYRNLTEYLDYFSDYLDSRVGSMLATADLYGKHSDVYQEVDKAWDAVGVIDEPIITSVEVYDVTATTAKIKGTLLPRGDILTYYFEYGTTPDLGSSSSTYEYSGMVEGILTGLQPQTKYYLKLVATNENGSTSYNSETFTTISLAPLVNIKPTVDVTESTATMHGEINPNSLFTSFYFEYGLSPELGLTTATYPLSDTTVFVDVSASVVDLQPRKTYYYRLVATNGFSSSVTGLLSFFTAVKPVITSYAPATAPVGAEVTIFGQNFNTTSGKNIVSFGATRGTILSSSSTEIKVTVPPGASFGPISLLDAESGLATSSIQEFVPTFTGEFRNGSLQLRVGIADIYIWQALVEDMDGDRKPDIVARHYQGISVFQNVNPGGDITEESFIRNTVPSEFSMNRMSLVDFDGNGLKDIVGGYQNGLRIYPNLSVPGYIFFGPPVDLPVVNSDRFAFDDFDSDGRIDIAAYYYSADGGNMVNFYRNQNPKGNISSENFERVFTASLDYDIYFLTSGDLNNDGTPELVPAPYETNYLPIIRNKSHAGVFDFVKTVVDDPTRGRFVRYVPHDLNSDGWRDVLSHSPYEAGNLAIRENLGISNDISLNPPVVLLNETAQSTIDPADMNGDGKVDLVVGLNNRRFLYLENQSGIGDPITSSSFKKLMEFGTPLPEYREVTTHMAVNDLNGDGRPDIVNAYSYNYYPYDGYQMEIWQNAPAECIDPTLITLEVSKYSATVILPPNTTLDQFEIEYASSGSTNWWTVYSTEIDYLSSGWTYQLRVRAKCYLGYTDYYYLDFTTPCVDVNSFTVSNIGVNSAYLDATEFYSYEIQYSLAGKNEWVEQYSNQLTGLLPGTNYEVRFRGHCATYTSYHYREFTTLCPELSSLTVTSVEYNKAVVNWSGQGGGKVVAEYSADQVNWIPADEQGTMFPLTPAQQYFVRGKMACTDVSSGYITTYFTTACPKVADLHLSHVTPFSVRLSWTDESTTGKYVVTFARSSGIATTDETTDTYFDLVGLEPGTVYNVSVAPECVAGEQFTGTSFSTLCFVPFALMIEETTHTTATVSWQDEFDGVPYSVDYSVSGSNIWQTSLTTSKKVTLANLRPGTRYEVRVHINCTSETARYISRDFYTELYSETTVAPNPTENRITIYPSWNLIGSPYTIHDTAGRVILSGKLRDYTIDLSDFHAGIYFLKIEGERPFRIVRH